MILWKFSKPVVTSGWKTTRFLRWGFDSFPDVFSPGPGPDKTESGTAPLDLAMASRPVHVRIADGSQAFIPAASPIGIAFQRNEQQLFLAFSKSMN
jgi:hypothetical protein